MDPLYKPSISNSNVRAVCLPQRLMGVYPKHPCIEILKTDL